MPQPSRNFIPDTTPEAHQPVTQERIEPEVITISDTDEPEIITRSDTDEPEPTATPLKSARIKSSKKRKTKTRESSALRRRHTLVRSPSPGIQPAKKKSSKRKLTDQDKAALKLEDPDYESTDNDRKWDLDNKSVFSPDSSDHDEEEFAHSKWDPASEVVPQRLLHAETYSEYDETDDETERNISSNAGMPAKIKKDESESALAVQIGSSFKPQLTSRHEHQSLLHGQHRLVPCPEWHPTHRISHHELRSHPPSPSQSPTGPRSTGLRADERMLLSSVVLLCRRECRPMHPISHHGHRSLLLCQHRLVLRRE